MRMRAYMSALEVQDSWKGRPVRINGVRCSLAVELMKECEAIARQWGEFAREFGLETTADWMLWEVDELAAKRHARAELNRNRTRGR